jgi:hypothetical protein
MGRLTPVRGLTPSSRLHAAGLGAGREPVAKAAETNMKQYIVIAGDSGVYSGWSDGGVEALGADGRVVLHDARHLRRYYTAGRTGDGSAADLARLGLDPSSPSVTGPVPGASVLLGVRRAFTVQADALASFGVAP